VRFSLIALTILLAACGSSPRGDVEAAVKDFLEALENGDRATLLRLWPPYDELDPDTGAQLASALAEYPDRTIGNVRILGESALAEIRLSSKEKAAGLLVPLRNEGGRWVVAEDVRVSTTIDFIPAE
jgi:hypothetical protein